MHARSLHWAVYVLRALRSVNPSRLDAQQCLQHQQHAANAMPSKSGDNPELALESARCYLQGAWLGGLQGGHLGGWLGQGGGLRGVAGSLRAQRWARWGAHLERRLWAGRRAAGASRTRPCQAGGRCS